MMDEGILWGALKLVYFMFKATVIIGLIVGIGISQQCHNQMVEICQLAGGCD